jgi:hypothetical protein
MARPDRPGGVGAPGLLPAASILRGAARMGNTIVPTLRQLEAT